jgi:hypothetical protein
VLYQEGGGGTVKLVVDRDSEREDGANLSGTEWSRPRLTVIPGGLARPRRLEPPRPTAERSPRVEVAEPEPSLDLDEVTIYLRPIPAWVPRLW